jgi:hypothetical protein
MAVSLSASIYGVNGKDLGYTDGRTFGFPTAGVIIRPSLPAVTLSGVSCPTIIQVLPTGLNQPGANYYTAASVASLITAANT